MAQDFKAQVKRKLKELTREQVVWYAWRCAVRALPFLGAEGNFEFWKPEDRQTHTMSVLRAIDLNADALGRAFATTAAAATAAESAFSAAKSAATAGAGAAATAAAKSAYAAAATDDAAADNAVYVYYAAAASAADARAILLQDIDTVKSGGGSISMTADGRRIWPLFVQALEKEGCGYWVRVIEQWFADGCVKDRDALERRINVPEEILEKGASVVGQYLEALEKKGATRINEARVIILGDKGAGKTCLARRLMDPDAEMTTDAESTAGVDTSVWELEDDHMNIRIWDFAGHTVTHAVHKFFLSERCLYVLVYDGRTEERNRLEYWLDHVKNYGGSSEVIILVNLRDGHTPRLPINTLKEKYPIHSVVFFSIQDDRNRLENFRNIVSDYILKKPSWNVANFPKSYDSVKDDLESFFSNGNGSSDFIGRDEFDAIARKHQVDKPDALLSHLHVLGVSLWYNEMAQYNTMVLNPEWISQGVYQIINWAHEEKKYQIRLDDLKLVFSENAARFPEEKHEFLYDLMKHYELAYETEDCEKCLVIPHLLDEDQPLELPKFSTDNTLKIRYNANRDLPPDTISRFIVRHSKQIAEPELQNVWRNGVILDNGSGCTALVREDDRMITAEVKGAGKSTFIAAIRDTLDNIFSNYTDKIADLEYWVTPFQDSSVARQGVAEKDLYIPEDVVVSHALNQRAIYDSLTNQEIPTGAIIVNYNITQRVTNYNVNGTFMQGDNAMLDQSTHTTFNFQNCNIDLRGNLNDLARRLRKQGEDDEAEELEDAAELLKKIESTKDPEQLKGSPETGLLKRIVDDLNDENSTLHKTVGGIKKGFSIAQDIAKGYNDIAQWAGLPQVPRPFLGKR